MGIYYYWVYKGILKKLLCTFMYNNAKKLQRIRLQHY